MIFTFFNVKKDPIQGSICFKLVPKLLVLGTMSKMALSSLFILHLLYALKMSSYNASIRKKPKEKKTKNSKIQFEKS